MAQDPTTLHNVCRVCLTMDPLIHLHSLADKDVRNLFEECTSLKVQLGENRPSQLCELCFANCRNWSKFKYRAEEADKRINRTLSSLMPEVKVELDDDETQLENDELDYAIDPSHIHLKAEEPLEEDDDTERTESEPTTVQKRQKEKTDPNEPKMCEHCGLQCTKKALWYHIRTKHGQKTDTPPRFQCTLCEKTFGQLNNLKLHEKKHLGQRDFKCASCDKAYFRRHDLNEHVDIVHRQKKRFSCDQCGMEIKSRWALKVHVRSHSGLKPFGCEQCGKVFGLRVHLNRHRQIHTGEKPFACDECDYASNRRSNLTLHQRKVHNKDK